MYKHLKYSIYGIRSCRRPSRFSDTEELLDSSKYYYFTLLKFYYYAIKFKNEYIQMQIRQNNDDDILVKVCDLPLSCCTGCK